MSRERLPQADPRTERRRAQYRNHKHRLKGQPEEFVPPAPDMRKLRTVPPEIKRRMRANQRAVRSAVDGTWVVVG